MVLANFYPDYLKEIIAVIEDAGFEAYIVGGCLRDFLLGRSPKDYDVAASASPQEITSLFGGRDGFKTVETGIKYGTVTVLRRGNAVEVTTFRTDGDYSDLRRPDNVSFTRNIREDLSRRDFTINAMAYSDLSGLIDPFGGKNDLENGRIRAVGAAAQRFTEDALRILRAFRFASQLGFDIDRDTLDGAVSCRSGLEKIARERVGVEFYKLVSGKDPLGALELMIQSGILPYILGGFSPNETVLRSVNDIKNDFCLRAGALLLGAGREFGAAILGNLKYSNKIIRGTLAVTEGLGFLSQTRVDTEKGARIFINRHGEAAKSIAETAAVLGFIDIGTKELIFRNAYCGWRISDLAVTGSDLALIGLSGAEIGVALEELLAAVMENPPCNNRDSLLRFAGNKRNKRRDHG